MPYDYLSCGPNNTYTTYSTNSFNYVIPQDFTSADISMTSAGGGGGGGAHAYHNGTFRDRHARAGGGGGGAGARISLNISNDKFALFNIIGNQVTPLYFSMRGATLTAVQLGKKGTGGTGGYDEDSGTASVYGTSGSSGGDVYFSFMNNGVTLTFRLYGGNGGSRAYARATSSSDTETPGGDSGFYTLMRIDYNNGSNTYYNYIYPANSSSEHMRVGLGDDDYANDVTIYNTDRTQIYGGVEFTGDHTVKLYSQIDRFTGSITLSWNPQYNMKGSAGDGSTGGAGGTYTYSGVSFGGGKGGNGVNGESDGTNGNGYSSISMNMNRDSPYLQVRIPTSSTTEGWAYSDKLQVRTTATSYAPVKNMYHYDGTRWVRSNGPTVAMIWEYPFN